MKRKTHIKVIEANGSKHILPRADIELHRSVTEYTGEKRVEYYVAGKVGVYTLSKKEFCRLKKELLG